MGTSKSGTRHLCIVLGDQLDEDAPIFKDFDNQRDALWMAENAHEATHVWCHKLRLVAFFAAMRHHRDRQRDHYKRVVHYHALTKNPKNDTGKDFSGILSKSIRSLKPEKLVVTHPGDHRVLTMLQDVADKHGLELDVQEDTHFYCTIKDFEQWASQRKSMMLEHFYRKLRKREDVLMTSDGDPAGGDWNYDKQNRESFGKDGPPLIKDPISFTPDDITREVMEMVQARFADHPGEAEHFDLPLTRGDARRYLTDFIKHRLPTFGTFEDAMWTDQPILYHSRLSFLLNIKLLSPRECVEAAVDAYNDGKADIQHVEGFVRQVLGWREFIRGVYWHRMPGYIEMNALGCRGDRDVPQSFWDGQTDMNCVAQSMKSVIELGYAHHIQRLMVLGLFAMQLGVHPRRFHDWHMAMYLDAVDWVSLPNTLGMSQYGDGGVVGTKPYCATGKYIKRMSNYCTGCKYDPDQAVGDDACPITTLYWDFLDRHADEFRGNNRMAMQLKNLDRKSQDDLQAIRKQAHAVKMTVGATG